MFCVKCGSELYPNTKVCPNCRFDNANFVSQPAAVGSFVPSVAPMYPDAYAEGNILVVPRNAALPASCVKCGGVPKEPWLKKTFYWHNPLLYILALFSPLIYVIVALIVRKKVQLLVPICDLHESKRKSRLWMGVILLLACIPVSIAFGTYVQSENAPLLAFFLGFAMFIAGLLVIASSYVLRPTYIGDDCAKFKGAHPEFLARLKPLSVAAVMAAQAPRS